MRTLLLAAVAVATLGSASAYAGEGNGPSFPGLNTINTGVTTSFVDAGAQDVTTTVLMSSGNGHVQPVNSLPRTHGKASRAQAMIATLSGAYAG